VGFPEGPVVAPAGQDYGADGHGWVLLRRPGANGSLPSPGRSPGGADGSGGPGASAAARPGPPPGPAAGERRARTPWARCPSWRPPGAPTAPGLPGRPAPGDGGGPLLILIHCRTRMPPADNLLGPWLQPWSPRPDPAVPGLPGLPNWQRFRRWKPRRFGV